MDDVTPENAIISFLDFASAHRMGVIVLSAFERDGKVVMRSNHTLADEHKKMAFLLQFLKFDDKAFLAAAQVIHKTVDPAGEWENLSEAEQKRYVFAAGQAVAMANAVATANSDVPAAEKPNPIV